MIVERIQKSLTLAEKLQAESPNEKLAEFYRGKAVGLRIALGFAAPQDTRVSYARTLDYSDLTDMIEETFGHPWDYQQGAADGPIENDSQTHHEINPDDPDWTAESLYAIENWIAEGARSDDFDMSVDMFLAALHSRGKLAAGPITISVSW